MKSVLVFVLLCFFTINYAEGACVVPECRAGNISCKAFDEAGSYALVNNNCNISGVNIKPNDIICGCGEVNTGEALRLDGWVCSSYVSCTYIRVCAKGYYGDPYSNGCHQCSDGGTTNGTGATQVYNCYKIIEKDTPDGHGRRQEKCYFQIGYQAGYTNCVAEDGYPKVISCNAGYYAVGSECSPVGKGYYSPDSDTERYQCPTYTKDTSKVNGTTATTTSASIKDCMVPAYIDDVTKETFTDYKGTYFFPNNCEHPGN